MDREDITIASYNVLHPHLAVKQGIDCGYDLDPAGEPVSNWPERGPQIINNLSAIGMDIICLQEVGPLTLSDLRHAFQLASFAPHPVFDPLRDQVLTYGNAIMTHGNRLLPFGQINLHEKDSPTRSAAASFFRTRSSGRKIMVLSLHLAGYLSYQNDPLKLLTARKPGFLELAHYLSEVQKLKPALDAVIVAGDFNEDDSVNDPVLSRFSLLKAAGYQHDTNLRASEHDTGRKIDWIHVWSKRPVTLTPVTVKPPYPRASDHLPVATRISFT